MRPVSVAVGRQDRHFKYISGLGEERSRRCWRSHPARRPHRRRAVLQRGVERAFSDGEVCWRRRSPPSSTTPSSAARSASAARRAAPIGARCDCRAVDCRRRRDGARRAAADAVRADRQRTGREGRPGEGGRGVPAEPSGGGDPRAQRLRRPSSACTASCARRPPARMLPPPASCAACR